MDRSFYRMSTTRRLCDHLSLDDFVFLNPTGHSLKPDDTRTNFFLHIGLDERNYRHRLIYRKMKAEAKAGMNRLFSTRRSLQPELVSDQTVLPPYNLSQITELAFQQQIARIYEASSKQTRGIYDIVGGSSGNWAIRWLLWRVIQGRVEEESRATSSGAETDFSIPSTCSSAMEYHIPGSQATHKGLMSSYAMPSYYYSDSEDWDDAESTVKRIKAEPDDNSYRNAKPLARSSFWTNVLNT